MIYTKTSGVADGIQKAMNTAILLCTTQPPIAMQFLSGEDRVICVFWEGDLSRPNDFDPERGDGRIEILVPGAPGFQFPPTFDQINAATNIRSGIPLWLLHPGDARQPGGYTLAVGALHPRHSSITADLYCPETLRKLCRAYFADPRRDMNHPQEDWLSFSEQKQQIEAAGGTPDHGPLLAPQYRGFLHA